MCLEPDRKEGFGDSRCKEGFGHLLNGQMEESVDGRMDMWMDI